MVEHTLRPFTKVLQIRYAETVEADDVALTPEKLFVGGDSCDKASINTNGSNCVLSGEQPQRRTRNFRFEGSDSDIVAITKKTCRCSDNGNSRPPLFLFPTAESATSTR